MCDTRSDGPLAELLRVSRSPLGPPVVPDLPVRGPYGELARVLGSTNGFTVFNAGVQVYRAGPVGLGPDLFEWNLSSTWKDSYGGLADGLFCFGQDLFGVQFAIAEDLRVVAFDPEDGRVEEIGTSLDDWAGWLLDDPSVRGAASIAKLWQDRNGALDHWERLIARKPFVLGGAYDLANLRVEDSVTAMQARGPIAQQLHDLPDGREITFTEYS